jgi:DNA repair protein RadC
MENVNQKNLSEHQKNINCMINNNNNKNPHTKLLYHGTGTGSTAYLKEYYRHLFNTNPRAKLLYHKIDFDSTESLNEFFLCLINN